MKASEKERANAEGAEKCYGGGFATETQRDAGDEKTLSQEVNSGALRLTFYVGF